MEYARIQGMLLYDDNTITFTLRVWGLDASRIFTNSTQVLTRIGNTTLANNHIKYSYIHYDHISFDIIKEMNYG